MFSSDFSHFPEEQRGPADSHTQGPNPPSRRLLLPTPCLGGRPRGLACSHHSWRGQRLLPSAGRSAAWKCFPSPSSFSREIADTVGESGLRPWGLWLLVGARMGPRTGRRGVAGNVQREEKLVPVSPGQHPTSFSNEKCPPGAQPQTILWKEIMGMMISGGALGLSLALSFTIS